MVGGSTTLATRLANSMIQTPIRPPNPVQSSPGPSQCDATWQLMPVHGNMHRITSFVIPPGSMPRGPSSSSSDSAGRQQTRDTRRPEAEQVLRIWSWSPSVPCLRGEAGPVLWRFSLPGAEMAWLRATLP